MEKWYSQRTYDPETRTTRIDNYFPEGEGSEIRVTKSWLDGDDAAHRYKVEVELVAKKDMANEDGSVSYEAGDVVKPTNGQPIVLSSDELWYAEVGVPIGGLSYKDFEAREVALIDDNGTPNDTSDDVRYPVLTKDEANDDPQYTDELWLNAGWTNPENRRVVTPEHVYEVKTTYNDEIESCEVTNRRLGLLDLTVTKDWYDGLGDDVAEGTRPGATLTLSNQEYPNAFTLNENGELMVSVSGNTLPVSDSDGNPVKASIVDADGNPVTDGSGGSARIDIDTTDTSTTYEFFGLPKYDANGMNVHYDVTEAWTGDAGDYHSTKTVGDYIVEEGARHFHDTQQIDFDNRRSGTRDVTFYKTWNDNYVNDELNQRPDIYLEVYQVVGDGEPQFVDRYLHLTWSAAEEAGEGQSDASRHQKVVISDLPKYDSNGNEITYYAVEVMPADGEALNYTDVKFNYDSITAADAADADAAGDTGAEPAKSTDNAVKVSETESDDPQVNGTGWALREDGTFVNSLSDDLVANGTKLWENIPGNVEQDDLPAITVYLQQKLASDAEWPNMFVEDIGTKKVSGTVASTDQLKRDENNQYSYTITEDYQGNPLPRYDADGNLYQYRAVEIAWGLLDQPGGFTADDITGINLTPIRDGKDQTGTDLTGKVFMIQHGETGSFLLRNVYSTNSEKGNLTVKKLFSGRDANDPYPDVTFNVYRYYITGQDEHGQTEHSAPALVASHTITGDEFKAASGSGDGNNSLTYTFENLEVYAPDGSRWIYYVAEQSIDGYQTSVGTGDINGPDSRLVSGELVDATGVTVSDDSGVAMRSEDLDNANETVIKSNDTNVDVTFMNNYKPDSANLTGMKVWHDYNNIFTVRPDTLDLAFTRTAGDLTEDVEVQTGDPEGENYLAWTKKEDTGGWTFELNNIEKWAPNGKAWTYTVKEALPSGTESHYTVVAGSSSISSTSTTGFKLENALNGQATVEKKWEDGGDPYGLRPETVTVELQARYRTAATEDGALAGNWSNWDNAYDVWTIFADKDALAGASLQPGYVTRELSANNGWKGSWNRLPVIARQTADTPINEIEYRVVEVKIGDQDISSAIKTDVDTPDENVYGEVHPYQPEFENTTASNGVNSFSSKTTNRLETAEVTASKSWKDDNLNGTDDAWGTRPVDGNNWTVTYFLQQKLEGEDDGAWKWVVKAGSEADATGSATQDGLVSFTISNGMTSDENHAVTVNDDGSVQVTWKNLPECNEDGTPYNYRIVEQVPGSYDVTGATEVKDADTAHRYFVVGAGDTGSQAFENDLRTVNLTGTKNWNDYGTGFAPTFDKNNAPQMVLYRQVGNDTTTAEQAKMKDGSAAPQPTWTNNGDGTWTFTYTGLPAANENDQPYIYWAEEQAGSGNADGFYPVYGGKDGSAQSNASNDAAGTTTDKEATADQDGAQTNEVITNVATRFTLDKMSDWRGTTGADEPEHLNGIELSVVANDRTYAVWERDANGAVTTWVNPEGGATKDAVKTDTYKMTATDAAGYIVGLHAGSYTVTETGTVPAGYAKAPDVPITISADGKITSTTQGAVENGDKPGVSAVITVDAVDPVLCGHLELTKLISSDGTVEADDAAGLKGATFDLYRVDCDNDGKDELIAKNLTSDANGKVTTVANETAIEKTASGGTFDLTYGGKYTKLSDGLPEGEYYFVETNATPGAVMPEGDAAKSEVLTITQDNHYAYTNAPVSKQKGNETFNATVELIKYDTTSLDGINGVEFSLKYRPEGFKDSGYPVDMGTFTTKHDDTLDKDGVLVLPDLEKGDYLLTETKNTGYDIAGDNGFTATFTIDNDDDDRTFVVWQDDGKAIDFTVTNGKLDHGAGIPNARQFGQATLRKLGANGSIDATFELQIKVGNEWKTVASNLETGNEYALAFNADGVTATATDAGDLSIGQLRVTGLTWNTYRFQETATASGYLPEDENGPLTSSEFTIGRDNAASTNVGVTVENQQTELRINKQSPTGETLNGAKFTVTPVGDSTFVNPTVLGSDYDAETGAVTLTTKSTGLATLKGQLMVGGTYEIYEVAGPSGYDPVDATFRIHVENNGYLTVVDDQGQEAQLPDGYERTGVDGTGTEAFSFIATNEPMAIDLTKVSAEDGTTLQGAQFRLTGQVMNDGNTTHSYATDANGAIHINDGLMGGVKYSLHEETTPAGYLEMEPLYFYMDSRGEIDPVDVNGNDLADDALPAGWTVNGNKISFTAADEPTRLTLQKTDENGNPLAGATFTVTPANDSKFADGTTDAKTLTTELNADSTVAEGTLIAQLVVGNSYTIQETGAPEGYELVEDSFTVTVEEDGTLAVTGGTLPNGYSRPDNTTFVLTLQDTPVEIGIVKHDATDGAVLLPGATFRIEGDFAGTDETSIERTTDANGRIDLESLLIVGQEYTVTETKASAGYELRTESMKFMVENDGTLTQTQAATGFGLSAAPAETVEVSDEPIEATLIKTGTDNPDPAIMVGAQFEIKGDFVNQDHEIVKDKALTLTTGGDGTLSLTNMRNGADTSDANIYDLVAGNTYTIEETQAPSEYETVPGTLTFTVNDDGTLTKESGPDAWTISENGGVAVVTATDKPIEVMLQKVSAVDSTKMLEGATFELYKVEEDGTTNKMSTVSTGTDGTLALDGLVGGATYTLHEVTAPAGYELLPDVTFTVTKNGSVELEGETAGYTVVQDNAGVATITAADTPIDAQLVKTDEAGTPLAGAIFTIQGAFAGDYEGESEITLAPSDANGIVAIPSAAFIAGETYTVAEITAPDGFERAGIVKFVVGTDGTITLISNDEGVVSGDEPAGSGAVAGDNTGATDAGDAAVANNDGSIAEVSAAVSGTNGSGTYTASADGGMAVITATNHPVEVTLTKTDGGEGLLPGAEFTATAKVDGDQGGVGGAHSVTATTDENGVAVLSGLIAGTTYTLAETKAPAGYELLTDTLEFTVQPDGTIDAGWFPPAAFSIGTAKDSVTVADNPLEVSLVKRAPNGAPLAGAEFTVEGQFPDGEISKTFASDESGIVFNQIQLAGSAEGTHYTVTETKAPEGYALPEGSLDLVVFEDGTVQVADGSSADMKENASVEESNGVAIVSLNNEPLPGTELPKTSDSAILPLIAGALGLLGLWALVMGGIAYRRFRGSED